MGAKRVDGGSLEARYEEIVMDPFAEPEQRAYRLAALRDEVEVAVKVRGFDEKDHPRQPRGSERGGEFRGRLLSRRLSLPNRGASSGRAERRQKEAAIQKMLTSSFDVSPPQSKPTSATKPNKFVLSGDKTAFWEGFDRAEHATLMDKYFPEVTTSENGPPPDFGWGNYYPKEGVMVLNSEEDSPSRELIASVRKAMPNAKGAWFKYDTWVPFKPGQKPIPVPGSRK